MVMKAERGRWRNRKNRDRESERGVGTGKI